MNVQAECDYEGNVSQPGQNQIQWFKRRFPQSVEGIDSIYLILLGELSVKRNLENEKAACGSDRPVED